MIDPSDPSSASQPAPILPYRNKGGENRLPLPPAEDVYQAFGWFSLITAGLTWLLIGGGWFWAQFGRENLLPMGCCGGFLSWIISTTLALTVVIRSQALGRRIASIALLLDLVLLITLLGFRNSVG